MISPTTKSSVEIKHFSPFRIVVTIIRLLAAFRIRNCLSFCRSLIADTFRQTKIAAIIADPSNQPVSHPSVYTPKDMEMIAEKVRRIIVISCIPTQIRCQYDTPFTSARRLLPYTSIRFGSSACSVVRP